MFVRAISGAVLAVCLTVTAVYSQSQQQKSPTTQQQPIPQERGSEQAPFIIQIQQAPNTETNSNPDAADRSKGGSNGWLFGWSLSDKIAIIASSVAFLQFLALIGTIYVMVRTARRQLRAYVFAENGGLIDGTMMNPPVPSHANEPGVALLFKNSGQTPAYRVVSWGQVVVQSPGNEGTLLVPSLQEHFANNIGPDGTMPKFVWYGRQLSAAEIQEVSTGAKFIYVHGRLEYRDAFNRKRWTNFRYAYAGPFPPPPGVGFNVTEQGNDAN